MNTEKDITLKKLLQKHVAVYRPKDNGGTQFGTLITFDETHLVLQNYRGELARLSKEYDIREVKNREPKDYGIPTQL